MNQISMKPYLIRGIYQWCCDASLTPYITVWVDKNVQVPNQYVKEDKITLNISVVSTQGLELGNETVSMKARFSGVSYDIFFPVANVLAIFSKETGQGMPFELEEYTPRSERRGDDAKEEVFTFVPAVKRSKRRSAKRSDEEGAVFDLEREKQKIEDDMNAELSKTDISEIMERLSPALDPKAAE